MRERQQCDDVEALAVALDRARAGDEVAFVTLYRWLQPKIYRYVYGLVGAEAEDVTAETWLHVARDLESFSGDVAGLRAWVATIARHRAVDLLRSRSRRPVVVEDLSVLPHPPAQDSPEAEVVGRYSAQQAIDLIATLPTEQAEAVLLRVVVGLDAPAAAAVLGKRPTAVRVAAHRGLKRLAVLVTQVDGGGGHAPSPSGGKGPAGGLTGGDGGDLIDRLRLAMMTTTTTRHRRGAGECSHG